MDLLQVKLYRMTHMKNVPHILQYGITYKRSVNANPNYVTIGDVSLIDTRSNKIVSIDNGDLLNSYAPTIRLGDFIPFYFGIRMPMLYVMQNGGNFVEHATPPKDIVYLVCSLNKILEANNSFYFSDGHATDNYTTFYDSNKVSELPQIVDWNAVKAPYWGGSENLNIKRKKQAEFLVTKDIPPEFIVGFGCYNKSSEKELLEMGITADKIKVIPSAYY